MAVLMPEQKNVFEYIKQVNFISFFKWYFIDSLDFWYAFITHLTVMFWDVFGISEISRNLFRPYRRDFTVVGYFMGFMVRIVWLLGTFVMLVSTFVGLFALSVMFYAAPFYLLWKVPFLVPVYALICFFLYVWQKHSKQYWDMVASGTMPHDLRRELWRRLELPFDEVEPIFLETKRTTDAREFILYLRKHNLSERDFFATHAWILRREWYKQAWQFWREEFFVRKKGIDVGWVGGFLSELKQYSLDLTLEAARGHLPHSYGRNRELSQMISVLQRPQRNNVLLVGPAGVGKSSLVYSIAWLILGKRISVEDEHLLAMVKQLEGYRVVELNVAGLVGGRVGSVESRLNEILAEIKHSKVILFLNQVENLIQAGLAGYLSPLLASNSFPIIATTTPRVLSSSFTGLSEFVSDFEIVKIGPPSVSETIGILQHFVDTLEEKNHVFITYPALEAAVEYSERYIHDAVLPSKAIAVLVKASELNVNGEVRIESVMAAISQMTGIPVGELSAEESKKLLNLELLLREYIIGQEEGVREIARAMRRARTRVGSNERPIAAFLFLGPTGVGKTLTAKTLAQVYFTPQQSSITSETEMDVLIEKNFIRFDMSEYSEPGAVDRFIKLATEAIQAKPFSLVLLDEFEKSERKIQDLFLQIFEDGRLTNEFGEVVDFRNSIIIATSNALQTQPTGIELLKALQPFFRPELINRFDGIVLFNPIQPSDMLAIVSLELNKLKLRLFEAYQLTLSWTPELQQELAKISFDPEYGARPLRRIIQNRLEDGLAQKILRQELGYGDSYQLTLKDLQ